MEKYQLEDEKNILYIPFNVPPGKQIISGYTWRELRIAALSFLISCILGVIIYSMIGTIIGLIAPIILITFVTIALVGKDKHNENTIDKIRIIIKFSKMQKKYYYKYTNIYEGKINDDKNI